MGDEGTDDRWVVGELSWATEDGDSMTRREAWRYERYGNPCGVSLDAKCVRCGYLLSHRRWPLLRLPYWVWLVWKGFCKWVAVVDARLHGECPQCMFDRQVRGW
jgi:hypothetical protein